jgi:GAF domain-containing protein
MRARHVALLPSFTFALLAACSDRPLVCTDELRSSLVVDVVDAQTGAPAAAGAVVLLRSAFVHDSISVPTTSPNQLEAYTWFEDRAPAGVYTVTVRNEGYREWHQSNIEIKGNRCHTTSQPHLTARLQR